MTLKSAIATVECDMRYFGIGPTIYDVLLRVANHGALVRVLRLLALSELTLHECLPPSYVFKPISPDELARLAQDPAYDINPVLLQEVRVQGNRCFGIYHGTRVANYLFIYTNPAVMTEELKISFGRQYAYLCATFTHPDYRGKHMNSIGAGLAARTYLNLGFKKLLAYVDANNFSSLKSLHRIGWQTIDTIYVSRLFGRYFIHSSAGCAEHEFRITPVGTRAGSIGPERASRTKRRA